MATACWWWDRAGHQILGLLTATDKSYAAPSGSARAPPRGRRRLTAADGFRPMTSPTPPSKRPWRVAAAHREVPSGSVRSRSTPARLQTRPRGQDRRTDRRPVRIDRFEVLATRRTTRSSTSTSRWTVSSGTYIGTGRDVGATLGVGGHLTALRRTKVAGSGWGGGAHSGAPRRRTAVELFTGRGVPAGVPAPGPHHRRSRVGQPRQGHWNRGHRRRLRGVAPGGDVSALHTDEASRPIGRLDPLRRFSNQGLGASSHWARRRVEDGLEACRERAVALFAQFCGPRSPDWRWLAARPSSRRASRGR